MSRGAHDLRTRVHDKGERYKSFSSCAIGGESRRLFFAATDQLQQLQLAIAFARRTTFDGLDGRLFRIYGIFCVMRALQDAVTSVWQILGNDKFNWNDDPECKKVRDLFNAGTIHAARAKRIKTPEGKKRNPISSFISYPDCTLNTVTFIIEETGHPNERVAVDLVELIDRIATLIDRELEKIEAAMDDTELAFKNSARAAIQGIPGWSNYTYHVGKLSCDPDESGFSNRSFECGILEKLFKDLFRILDEIKYEHHFRPDFEALQVGLKLYHRLLDCGESCEAYVVYRGVRDIADGIVDSINNYLDK